MKELGFSEGEKIAEAIDKRIVSVAKQVFETSPMNKTKYGRIISGNNGFYSVMIDNCQYTKVPVLSSVGKLNAGDVVLCLIPNNQFSNIIIIGKTGIDDSITILYNEEEPAKHPIDGLVYTAGLTNGSYNIDCRAYRGVFVVADLNFSAVCGYVDLTIKGNSGVFQGYLLGYIGPETALGNIAKMAEIRVAEDKMSVEVNCSFFSFNTGTFGTNVGYRIIKLYGVK